LSFKNQADWKQRLSRRLPTPVHFVGTETAEKGVLIQHYALQAGKGYHYVELEWQLYLTGCPVRCSGERS
jgi:hypothetical protein